MIEHHKLKCPVKMLESLIRKSSKVKVTAKVPNFNSFVRTEAP